MAHYELVLVDGDNRTVVASFSQHAPVIEPPVDPPEDAPIIAVVTSKPTLTVRSSPKVSNSNPDNRVGVFQTGEQIWVSTETYATDGDDWIWRKIIKVNGASDPRVGKYVAEKKRDGTSPLLDLDEKTEIPPKVLTGDIQPIHVVSPAGIQTTRFKNGNEAWSLDPKAAVKTRSIIVAQEKLEQFHYRDSTQDFYLSMPADEYREHMDQANNKTGNPYQMNFGYYGGFVAHREFFTGHPTFTPNRLIDLTVKFCDDLAARNMQAILVLKDSLKHAHNFPVEDKYHNRGGDGRLNPQYYLDKAYEQQAIPFFEQLAQALAGHKGLAMVQLENESNIENEPENVADAYFNFARRVRDVWRKYDTASPFGLCIENTNKLRWKNANGSLVANEQVVEKFAPLVDFWQCHMYADPNAKTIYDKWLDQDRVYQDLFEFARNHNLVPMLDEMFIQHINKEIDVHNGTTEQLRIRIIDMMQKGLYLFALWNYHQGLIDRRLVDATAFTNVLENKTGYKGYYDVRALVADLAHVVMPRDFRWTVVN